MKLRFFTFLLLSYISLQAQTKLDLSNSTFSADINYGYNLSRVNANYVFDENMPASFQLSWQKANYLDETNFGKYAYSDFGLTFLYYNFKDVSLGKNYGLYGFMSYYITKPQRKWQLSARVSLGIAYNTKPYNKVTNHKNMLFGSHWLFPIDLGLWLKSPKILKYWRLHTGFSIFHYSNGNIQSPNYGANIPSLSLGVMYDIKKDSVLLNKPQLPFDKTLQYVVFVRGGFNESDYTDIATYLYPYLFLLLKEDYLYL
jgi:hypothetical protein